MCMGSSICAFYYQYYVRLLPKHDCTLIHLQLNGSFRPLHQVDMRACCGSLCSMCADKPEAPFIALRMTPTELCPGFTSQSDAWTSDLIWSISAECLPAPSWADQAAGSLACLSGKRERWFLIPQMSSIIIPGVFLARISAYHYM